MLLNPMPAALPNFLRRARSRARPRIVMRPDDFVIKLPSSGG